jgi:hypothetical protein
MSALTPAGCLLWIAASYLVFRHRFEPLILMQLFSSAPLSQSEAILAVARDFEWISASFLTLLLAAFAIPKFIRAKTQGTLESASGRAPKSQSAMASRVVSFVALPTKAYCLA